MVAFPSYHQPPEVPQPGEGTFHQPPMAIRGQVGFGTLSGACVSSPGDAGADASTAKSTAQTLTVIAFVGHQYSGAFLRTPTGARHSNPIQNRLCQLHFSPLGTLHQGPQWDSGAVDDHHHLGALALAGQTYCLAPFLAGTKVASTKACLQSSFPTSSKVPRSVVQMRSHTPMPCHSWRRRWQVESLPYRLGMSCHRAPDRSTQTIPLRVRRSSALRRPRLLGGGSRGLISSHWASAKSPAMVATP